MTQQEEASPIMDKATREAIEAQSVDPRIEVAHRNIFDDIRRRLLTSHSPDESLENLFTPETQDPIIEN